MDQLPPCITQWNELVRADTGATVFQTREWVTAWWAVFGETGRMLMVCLSDDGKLVGLAPLMQMAAGTTDEIVFIGHGRADYLDFISRPEDRERVISAALRAMHEESGWSIARLRNIPAGSATARFLPGACRTAGLWLLRGPDEICPALVNDGTEPTPADFLGKYRVRRASNALRRMGHFEVRDIGTIEEAKAHLPDFFEQHILRWKDTATPSLFHDHANRRFYERLVENLLPAGYLLFSVAELDGRPIAYHFGFDFGGRVLWYKPSYDKAFSARSPGSTIIEHLIGHVVKRGRRELDFTVGAEPFKQRYSNNERRNINLRIFKRRRNHLLASTRDRGYRAVRWVVRRLGAVRLLRGFRRQ